MIFILRFLERNPDGEEWKQAGSEERVVEGLRMGNDRFGEPGILCTRQLVNRACHRFFPPLSLSFF